MSEIVLTAGVRSNLLQLQKTADLITSTQTKLATGKRVNSALDNPINYFTAQGLINRSNDLGNLLDSMSSGISTITKLVQSALALVSQAQQTTDTTVRASLATQFASIQSQIGTLAGDSGFNGVNLLTGNNLSLVLNESGTSSVTITAVTFDSNGLGINNALNNWADSAAIAAAGTNLNGALTKLRTQSQSFGSNLSTVQIRQDFTKAM